MIDSHSHIYLPQFDEDRKAMLIRAKEAGVNNIYLPNIDSGSIVALKELANAEEMCLPMMGLHPGSVKENWKEELNTILEEIDTHPSLYKAIGEIGIDLYWDKTYLQAQKEVFATQIEKAKSLKLPIVIHCRDAFDEVFEVLEKHKDENLFGIFHCFTGNLAQAQQAIDLNLKLGIGGIVTFKNGGLDKVVKHLDLEHIVLETDAPYLAPMPYRGKRNEPSYLSYISQKVADIKEVDVTIVREQTILNTQTVFGE